MSLPQPQHPVTWSFNLVLDITGHGQEVARALPTTQEVTHVFPDVKEDDPRVVLRVYSRRNT